jgi:hypothetical protein
LPISLDDGAGNPAPESKMPLMGVNIPASEIPALSGKEKSVL